MVRSVTILDRFILTVKGVILETCHVTLAKTGLCCILYGPDGHEIFQIPQHNRIISEPLTRCVLYLKPFQ